MSDRHRIFKAADRLRLLAGQDASGLGQPLRVDSNGRLEVVGFRNVNGCRVYNSAAWTHNSSGSWLQVPFDSESYDTDGMHDNVTNNPRITIQTAGVYIIGGAISWAASPTGSRGIALLVDGSTRIASQFVLPTNTGQGMTISAAYQFTAGQYVELSVFQNSGGSLTVQRSVDDSPVFWAVML